MSRDSSFGDNILDDGEYSMALSQKSANTVPSIYLVNWNAPHQPRKVTKEEKWKEIIDIVAIYLCKFASYLSLIVNFYSNWTRAETEQKTEQSGKYEIVNLSLDSWKLIAMDSIKCFG